MPGWAAGPPPCGPTQPSRYQRNLDHRLAKCRSERQRHRQISTAARPWHKIVFPQIAPVRHPARQIRNGGCRTFGRSRLPHRRSGRIRQQHDARRCPVPKADQRLFEAPTQQKGERTLDPLNLAGAFSELVKGLGANPAAIAEAQLQLWHNYMELWERTARQVMGGEVEADGRPAPGDKRFRDKDWEENQVFDFIKQSYLLTANWLQDTVGKVEGLDAKSHGAACNSIPSNSPMRSRRPISSSQILKCCGRPVPDQWRKPDQGPAKPARRSRARRRRSWRSASRPMPSAVGENIATAPGKVVFRNDLIELLQYEPTTDEVYERPLLIFPPWINKFYILDLKPENSFIRWAVAQGYTVFVVSWVNPDKRLAKKTFEDYMREGIFAAARGRQAGDRRATGQRHRLLHRRHTAVRHIGLYGGHRRRRASTRPPSSPRSPISPKPATCRSSSTMPNSKRWSSR